jgi:CheY-like chemotaxis protein
MLLDAGYEVIEAASGPAALELLAADDRRTTAMVVDVVMPAMTGVELASIVHSTRPLLPVIFMTGYAAAHVLPTGAGFEVLRKPFQAADLEARVARALGRAAG